MRGTISDLFQVDTPCIVPLDGDHFAVAQVEGPDKIRVIHWNREEVLSRKEFISKWSGEILAVRPAFLRRTLARSSDSGNTIVVPSHRVWNLGSVPAGRRYAHTFSIRNVTNVPIRIVKLQSGCACASVKAPTTPINPWEEAYIGVEFLSGSARRLKREYIDLKFDPPFEERLEIRARVFDTYWISRAGLYIANAPCGATSELVIPVHIPNEPDAQIVGVRIPWAEWSLLSGRSQRRCPHRLGNN